MYFASMWGTVALGVLLSVRVAAPAVAAPGHRGCEVRILPSEVKMHAGARLRFTVICRDSGGYIHTPSSVEWRASSGGVDSAGLFRAPGEECRCLVEALVATKEGKCRVGAFVEVGPPLPSGAGERPGARASHPPVAPPASPCPETPVSVVVLPAVFRVRPGDVIRFSARTYSASGKDLHCPVEWSAEGGRISTDGLFVAGRNEGIFAVEARATRGDARGRATVEVSRLAPKVPRTILVLPASASVAPGGTVAFRVKVFESSGRRLYVPVEWSCTRGRVDSHGRYTAPEEVKAQLVDEVIASASNGVRGVAEVRIVPPAAAAGSQGGRDAGRAAPGTGSSTAAARPAPPAGFEILEWRQGGSLFKPSLRVRVKVTSPRASRLLLERLKIGGGVKGMAAARVRPGQEVTLAGRYSFFSTVGFRLRLLDSDGEVIGEYERKE